MLVLLVNDHLLKTAWPGPVTGKLSDLAGLVVAPALVSLLFWRRADLAATVLTGVLFALVKSTETGAEVASHAWTLVAGPSRVLADPTDLLALPALALAWWVRRRSLDHPPSARWRIVVTVPLALLSVVATSADPNASGTPPITPVTDSRPYADTVEVRPDGRINVHTADGTSLGSYDGGLTWWPTNGSQLKPGQSAMCVPGQATRCYQVVKGRLAVEQSDDGGHTWRPSWQASQDDLERMTRTYDLDGAAGRDDGRLSSTSLGVQARPGGHVVVVANGLDGILVRDVSGAWRRVGWPHVELAGADVGSEHGVALFLAACMLLGGIGAGLRHYVRVFMGFASATCLGVLTLFNGEDALSGPGPMALAGLALIVIGVGTAVCFVLAIAGRPRAVPASVGLLAAPLVYAAVYLPFAGWSRGALDSYGVAVALAVPLTALVLLASAFLIRNDARRAAEDSENYFDGTSTSSPT
ncbi:hypothetical protein AB0I81_09890 [Nonomuraea sp. NPDC050404]|uniref:hypothetical protein n=1 Tax=Nonomuraea sp. NPDC050404 TaxID=3155783 RepID=UPI00340DF1DF